MRQDIQEIFRMTAARQVLLFSRPRSQEIRPVCRKFTNGSRWNLRRRRNQAHLARCALLQVARNRKKNRKLNVYSVRLNSTRLLYTSTRSRVKLNRLLQDCNFSSICIHGGQNKENALKVQVLQDFNARVFSSPRTCLAAESCWKRVNVVNQLRLSRRFGSGFPWTCRDDSVPGIAISFGG
jgi:ATP-dependent RNA helicase UAP56/SUB2